MVAPNKRRNTKKVKPPKFDDIETTDPCPRCGTVMMVPEEFTKTEAERRFYDKHTTVACDRDIELNEWCEEMERTPCEICGKLGGGLYCDCWIKKREQK